MHQQIFMGYGGGGGGGGSSTTWDSGAMGSGIALSSGNMRAAKAASGWATVLGTNGKSSGKWQFEIVGRSATTGMFAGIADKSSLAAVIASYLGQSAAETFGYWANGVCYWAMTTGTTYAAVTGWGNNDIITVTVDLTVPEVKVRKNGTLIYTKSLPVGKTWYPATSVQSGGAVDLVPSSLTYPQAGFSDWA